ncbi:hypothetical protein CKAH01_19042 [Colletotrichum kahawae]|uniref:Uncharacterized protein n=1 Tax=Colletotrichum kahawae TaxID=34407 RepID=A0AAD9Y378_COLKA|nr:hypothetical protein CKAH01_19042 [Colletotrichum kahawae]
MAGILFSASQMVNQGPVAGPAVTRLKHHLLAQKALKDLMIFHIRDGV